MSFAGWVPIRRGIAEHVTDGRLTPNEYLALVQLILYADAGTGGGTVNAPLLMYRCGYAFSLDTAQRILRSLSEKRYIWYQPSPRTKKPGPYWVNKFEMTKGRQKLRYTNLAELFDKPTICQRDVWDRAVETAAQARGQTTAQPNHKYYKDKDKDTDTIPTVLQDECVFAKSKNEPEHNADATREQAWTRPCHVHDASMNEPPDTPRTTYDPGPAWGDDLPGSVFRTGEDAGYFHAATGRRLSFEEAKRVAQQKGIA